ncbi:MAG: potassium transporter TrkG [Bacteroidales bacterium]|nr:potassium transporter TrkG [Bacteroidales bacterium]
MLLYEFGFDHKPEELLFIRRLYLFTVITGSVSIITRYFLKIYRPRSKSLPIDILLFAFLVLVASQNVKYGMANQSHILTKVLWLYAAIFLVFFREFSAIRVEFHRAVFNPAQLFVLSFLLIIIAGTFLLLLTKATVTRIDLVDALFTSTSAVCVTGLTVVDTGSYFTEFGQIIIALLIQIGGLGIMTFTSYFSYFFRGGSSFESQLIISHLNLLTTAMMKKMNVPRLISRSVSQIHETILEAMEVTEIVRPEEETAERWAKKLTTSGMLDSFKLTENYSIVEVKVPKKYAGKTIAEVGFNRDYNIIVLTIMKNVKEKNILGLFRKVTRLSIEGVANAQTVLNEGDVMVLYGHNDNLSELLKE